MKLLLLAFSLAFAVCARAEDWPGRLNAHVRANNALRRGKTDDGSRRDYVALAHILKRVEITLDGRKGMEQIMAVSKPGSEKFGRPFYEQATQRLRQLAASLEALRKAAASERFAELCAEVEADIYRLAEEFADQVDALAK